MSDSKQQNSRRDFLKTSSLALGSFFIVPRHVLGKGYIAPSDKLNIAAIGAGGKGQSDIINAYNNGASNIVALCDVDWGRTKGTFEKFPNAKKYRDFRVMLQEMSKDIDAVTISTPDHFHAYAAMQCMQMGKHVYVQKPLTHNIAEARMLTKAARKYKVVTQMGNQGSSNPAQNTAIKWFDEGKIGAVHTVNIWTNRPVWPQGIPVPTDKPPLIESMSPKDWDTWVGPAQWVDYHPLYHPFKWRGWWNFGTGALGDIGCHTIDSAFRILGLGYPTEVECSVGAVFIKDWTPEYIPEGCPPSSHVEIKFPATKKNKSAMKMIWMDGGIRPMHPDLIPANEAISNDGGANGIILTGTKGIMTIGMYGNDPKIYLNSGEKIEAPKVTPTDVKPLPEYGHQVSWTEACKAGYDSKAHKALTSSFDYSGPLTETVLMGNLAIRSYMLRKKNEKGNFDFYGRNKLIWNGGDMKITNFDDANQFVGREYREGWKIADV
ncbi:Gfo/Idh/MocA family oxidoreductase [Arcicella aquatica]|uniref:Gfo/Idh/MocA family oxidoreductase n=1 Tax=Arcicella aquatica TaxID=217141 RepID=A0ABU5QQJ5_9BACT|nr:Gfo/Idh/MocA family oxidoreductase [Arcicella aquatica]MEA5258681.1 Gfo/Idh/MocA family oxidoreductase [Arcicella aquatica]